MKVTDREFIKLVERFVFKNEPETSAKIAAQKANIPPLFKTPQILYRGMILDRDLFEAIDKKNYKGFELKDVSSWTPDPKMAEKFVTDPSKRLNAKRDGKVGVIFKKTPLANEVVLNIQGYVLFMGSELTKNGFDELTMEMALEEAETLLDKGITLNKSNIYKTIKL